jgi:uncharacterized membrane protein YkvI
MMFTIVLTMFATFIMNVTTLIDDFYKFDDFHMCLTMFLILLPMSDHGFSYLLTIFLYMLIICFCQFLYLFDSVAHHQPNLRGKSVVDFDQSSPA